MYVTGAEDRSVGMLKTYLGVGDQAGRLGVKKFTVCD